jgi:hypothetical protein
MPPNEKEFPVRNRIAHLLGSQPGQPLEASADELQSTVRRQWSPSEKKRRWTAAQIILRRLLKAAKPRGVQHDR